MRRKNWIGFSQLNFLNFYFLFFRFHFVWKKIQIASKKIIHPKSKIISIRKWVDLNHFYFYFFGNLISPSPCSTLFMTGIKLSWRNWRMLWAIVSTIKLDLTALSICISLIFAHSALSHIHKIWGKVVIYLIRPAYILSRLIRSK